MDWHHPDYLPRRNWENRSAAGAVYDRYVAYMKNQLRELIDNYGDIGVLWFDGERQAHQDPGKFSAGCRPKVAHLERGK